MCELSSKCRGKENSGALGLPSLGVTSEEGTEKAVTVSAETCLVQETLSKWSEKNWKVSHSNYCVQSTCEGLDDPFCGWGGELSGSQGCAHQGCQARVFPALLYSWALEDVPKWSVIIGLKHLGWREGGRGRVKYRILVRVSEPTGQRKHLFHFPQLHWTFKAGNVWPIFLITVIIALILTFCC